MPDWSDLTADQIKSVLEYLASGGPEQKEADERLASAAGPHDVQMGQRLFEGSANLASGGRACIACHSLARTAGVSGGSLGPDLSTVYLKYQDKALTDFLKHACFPSEPTTKAGRSLTPQESFAIKAYLAQVARMQHEPTLLAGVDRVFNRGYR